MSCECEESKFPVKEGLSTVIGQLLGISISEVSAAAITITTFMLIFISFLICFPHLMKIDLKIQGYILKISLLCFNKIPRCGVICGPLVGKVVQFIVGIRPLFPTYLIIIGMILGVFFHYTGLNNALENELSSFNLDLFVVIFIPPLFIKTTYFGTKRKVFFHNFVLLFFHHYVLILIHTIGILISCFAMSIIFWVLSFGLYSYLECLLLSSIMSGVSAGSILGSLDAMKVNLRLYEVLEGESVLATPLQLIVYGVALSLIIGTTTKTVENPNIFGIIGLGILRFLYMLSVGIIVGISVGFIGCMFVKLTYPKNLRIFQPFCMYLFMFLSFFIASMLQSHGTLGMIPCSFFMARYSHFAMSPKSRETTAYIMNLFASVAGQLVYIYVGLSFVEALFDTHWDWILILQVNFFSIFLRFLYIFTVDFAWNSVFRIFRIETHKEILPRREIFVVAASGLKGALPFIFSFILPPILVNRRVLLTTSLMVVIPSLFIQGPCLVSLLKLLNLRKRRMSIREKVDLCKKMLSKLDKMKYYIPHVHSKPRLKNLLVYQVNKNFRKFKQYTSAYYHSMKFEKEIREKHFLWPESQISVRIMYKCFEMLEKVWLWSNEVIKDNPNPDMFILIDPDYGVLEKDLEFAVQKIEEINLQKERIRVRLSALLKFKQYEDSIIEIPEENYVLKMKETGHVPIALSPEFVEKKENMKSDHKLWTCFQSFCGFFVSKWDMIDVQIQRFINIDSISTPENIFLITTFLYRKYHWVAGNVQFDEDKHFLEHDLNFYEKKEEGEGEEEEEEGESSSSSSSSQEEEEEDDDEKRLLSSDESEEILVEKEEEKIIESILSVDSIETIHNDDEAEEEKDDGRMDKVLDAVDYHHGVSEDTDKNI